ncbi:membrane protein insertase YidC [Kitasatospora sp. NPDC059646]|uniref:membrane protein insertase YidC n=1 Tax=Kitasatospora sp. NPDC059646 TaxID=3346893 RepID=UPI0036A7A3E0
MSVLSVLDPAVRLAHAAVAALATVVPTAVAIVVFTLAVRAALHPLARSAARGERARARIAPQVQKLRKRHGKDRERLARELAALNRAEGISPFAGLLPALAQAPFFSVMYRLFTTAPGNLLDASLAGVPLGTHPTAAHTPAQFAVFAVLEAALLALAWWNVRRASALPVPDDAPAGLGAMRWLAFGTPLFALLLPLAGGVYLLTSTAWTAAERWYLHRPTAATGERGSTVPAARQTVRRQPAR